jgi:hypothetical protein
MRFVPSEMLRIRLSWLVIGGVAVILVAAAVDALRSSGSKTPSTERGLVRDGEREGQTVEEVPLAAVAETETGPLLRFTAQQLALRVERLAGTHLLALAHVRGGPCRTARLPIEVSLFYRNGKLVNPDTAGVSVSPQAFASTDLSPGVEVIAELHASYECGERRPRLLVAEARPYVARKWLPRGYVACLDDLGP